VIELSRDAFVARYGAVAEHSPWVAEEAFGRYDGDLAHAFALAIADAPAELQLALLRAHPDLAGKLALAGELTEQSAQEQSSAGLDRLDPGELAELAELNDAYRARFGFPFIICAREQTRESILAAFRERLGNEPEAERPTALAEVVKIVRLRLADL
jgi:2-oxo-4-hydroxy-4-carboxy-5-ureidoimidazoline decarboxylase